MEVSRKRLKRWWQQEWNGRPRCDWLHISWPSKPAPTPALRPQWRASVSGPPEQLHSPQRSEHKFSLAQPLSTLTMTSWNQKIFLTKGDICIYSLSASPEYRWSILANFFVFLWPWFDLSLPVDWGTAPPFCWSADWMRQALKLLASLGSLLPLPCCW